MIVARIVRVFAVDTPAGGAVEQRLAKVLELPVPPSRGQMVHVPDDPEAHPIDRVIVHARKAVDWTPGWKAAALIDVVLAPEEPDGLAAAFGGGWTAL